MIGQVLPVFHSPSYWRLCGRLIVHQYSKYVRDARVEGVVVSTPYSVNNKWSNGIVSIHVWSAMSFVVPPIESICSGVLQSPIAKELLFIMYFEIHFARITSDVDLYPLHIAIQTVHFVSHTLL